MARGECKSEGGCGARGEGELASWAGGRGACLVLVRSEGQHAVHQAANRCTRTKWQEEERGRDRRLRPCLAVGVLSGSDGFCGKRRAKAEGRMGFGVSAWAKQECEFGGRDQDAGARAAVVRHEDYGTPDLPANFRFLRQTEDDVKALPASQQRANSAPFFMARR